MPRARRPAAPILRFEPRAPGLRVEVHRLASAHPVFATPAHGHRFYEMLYFERGSGAHRLGDEVTRVRPGDLFVVAPAELHDATGVRDASGWLVIFAADAIDPGGPSATRSSHPALIERKYHPRSGPSLPARRGRSHPVRRKAGRS